ncbi:MULTISPECIES: hypothetical protein [unclassified Micromonospora]|uniref:hypothetical protein n=1 Tax=unclassified Micromonospora TaxID=2617518 RepID=UPI00104A89CD|nr:MULTISPECIES: hypothetical protein [unclassified Micromonospora]TDB80613.1 hypothetical protein E1182_08105 [Micromonospora sp. KC721]TDC42867.1 hypothetical protein E1166_06200 [Micromonospora sp. KC213]
MTTESRPVPRRKLWKVLRTAAAVAVLGSAVALAPAPAAATESTCPHSLVGTWRAKVQTSLPSTGETTFVFNPDGTIEPPPGEPVTDTWRAVGCNGFTFNIVHPHYDASGNVDGEVRGYQNGVLFGDRFASHGSSTVYNLNGEPQRSFTVQVKAERVPAAH